jgi:RNA polymerase sigma-70 factor (ECF subfamily)
VTKSSAAQSHQFLADCGDQIDAIYQECVTANPSFNVSRDDFAASVAGALEKYSDCFGPGRRTPVRKVRQFIKELQHADLYLALACARGNESAWWEFDRRHRSFVERLARHLLTTRADADEIIDHIYAELFGTKIVDGVRQSKFRTYTGRGTLQGWLRAVVSHAVIDFHRRRQDEISLDKFEETGEEPGLRQLPGSHAQRAEESMLANVVRERYRTATVAALDHALATLDDHEKLLLLYYHVDGLKLREIAKLVQEPMSPIRRWFQRRARSGRVHESTVMRWLEKAYEKVSERFAQELAGKHRLSAEEIEICMSIATDDLGQGINLKAISGETSFSKAAEGTS